MSDLIKYEDVEAKILDIQGQQVLLDSSVAELYGVETKVVNQAVRNNPDKFPDGYIISLDLEDWNILKSKILTSSWGGKNRPPKAFTEKGLYPLALFSKEGGTAVPGDLSTQDYLYPLRCIYMRIVCVIIFDSSRCG
ncbi:MAG: ORF6N domain-containing protein [Oscillospiraceae bacterium]|nr:ORF6N domain-containing protein [Oscillospiraceae bacterium]